MFLYTSIDTGNMWFLNYLQLHSYDGKLDL